MYGTGKLIYIEHWTIILSLHSLLHTFNILQDWFTVYLSNTNDTLSLRLLMFCRAVILWLPSYNNKPVTSTSSFCSMSVPIVVAWWPHLVISLGYLAWLSRLVTRSPSQQEETRRWWHVFGHTSILLCTFFNAAKNQELSNSQQLTQTPVWITLLSLQWLSTIWPASTSLVNLPYMKRRMKTTSASSKIYTPPDTVEGTHLRNFARMTKILLRQCARS